MDHLYSENTHTQFPKRINYSHNSINSPACARNRSFFHRILPDSDIVFRNRVCNIILCVS